MLQSLELRHICFGTSIGHSSEKMFLFLCGVVNKQNSIQTRIPFLDAGLVTLSRYPILATDSHYYRLGNQIDGWAPKQVLWSLVKLPGDNNLLHVFNTHMQVLVFFLCSRCCCLSFEIKGFIL
jgi:hypothetical protein